MEIILTSHRVQHYREEVNDRGPGENLVLLDERRDKAKIKAATYKGKTEHYLNKRVRPSIRRTVCGRS